MQRFFKQHALDIAFGATLAGASLLLYVLTLAPTVLEGDSGEFQTLLRTLGIVHTTGYPLYTLLGHAFTWLPLGDVAYRVNLFSAVATALSVPLIYLVARRITAYVPSPYDLVLAALTALTYAMGYSVWSQAVVASVYGLNALFVAGVLYLALRWSETPSPDLPPSKGYSPAQPGDRGGWGGLRGGHADHWFLALALVYGLSLTHHRTMLLWGPGLAIFVLWTQPGLLRRGRLLAKAALLCLLPLLLYLYIPLRAWQLDDQRVLAGLLPWITGSDFGGHLGAGFLQMDVPTQLARYTELLVCQYTWVGVGLGLVGLAWLLWRRRVRFTVLTGLSFLLLSAFALAYRYGDPMQATYNLHVYLLPAYLVWALWMGAGATALLAITTRILQPAICRFAICLLFALLPLALLFTTYPAVDMDRNDTVARYARRVLAQPFAPDALVFGEWDHITPLWYLQQVEGLRPDLTIVDAPVLDRHWTAHIAAQADAGRPIYFYRGPTRTDARYDVEPFGPAAYGYVARTDRPFREVAVPGLAHLVRASSDAPAHTTAFDFAGRVTLVGFDAAMDVPADAPLPVTLYWRAGPALEADYRVSLRLLDMASRVVAQMDKPADDFYDYRYPMTHWPADATIRDKYQLALSPGSPPGTYTLEVRVYGDAGELSVNGGPGTAAQVGPVTVAPPTRPWSPADVQPAHPLDEAVTPALRVLGYDIDPAEAAPGQSILVTVYWQAQAAPSADVLVSLRLTSPAGNAMTTTVPGHPCGGAYPTSRWRPGEVILDVRRLSLPKDLPDGDYTLSVHVSDGSGQASLGILPVHGRARTFDVPPIAHPLSLYLGDTVELLGYQITNLQSPISNLQLTLYWRCRAPMSTSYTVFAHLLDPDGAIRGQRDGIPCAGACPTDDWVVGEVIVDTYDIICQPDAPPGRYRLAVGMYDAETSQRLPVIDAHGTSLGDRVLLGTIEIR